MRHWAVVLAAAAVTLVELHAPGGHVIDINPDKVASIRPPMDTIGGGRFGHGQRWEQGTQCIIVMSNGRFNAVTEDCPTVMKKLTQPQKQQQPQN